ncbi:hypothetical protein FZC74_20680 [Sutcliffiella horikoshii]|uniref:Uncharacterized protein n=1 Tax=Sutcliffiella horikoshii TaxID=79883 RepID=A0AA94WIC2_9BACI|nr:hypothetical protein FZC74_20680 [Sutcliffiella horikoshii]
MKTSVTRKQGERCPHRRYEDLGDEKTGEKCPHRRYEDLGDEKTGRRDVLIAVMKTLVKTNREERCPHRRYDMLPFK